MYFARISGIGNGIDDLGFSCYKDVKSDGDPSPPGRINLSSSRVMGIMYV